MRNVFQSIKLADYYMYISKVGIETLWKHPTLTRNMEAAIKLSETGSKK